MGPPGLLADLETSGGITSAETLIKRAHELLRDWGIEMAPSKVSRLVRQFQHHAGDDKGFPFEKFLRTAPFTVEQRRHLLTRSDPTGERAVHRVSHPDCRCERCEADRPEISEGPGDCSPEAF
jgi:hypothetical protein